MRRFRSAMLRLWWVSFAAACTSQESDVPLSYYVDGHLGFVPGADGSHVSGGIDYIPAATRTIPCPVLAPDVTATIDGLPLHIDSRGGVLGNLDEQPTCDVSIRLSGAPGAVAGTTSDIVLTDGKTTIAVTYVALRTPRTWTVGTVQRGASATFQWSVESDARGQFGPPTKAHVVWTPDQGTGFDADVPVTGMTATLSVPTTATTGSGTFAVSVPMGSAWTPSVANCDGIAICSSALLDDPLPVRSAITP